MAVRNFWIEVTVDGRKTKIATGPRSKDGGMEITIKQRNNGSIDHALTVRCTVDDQNLRTKASSGNGKAVDFQTVR